MSEIDTPIYNAQDGTGRTFHGPGHVYVRYIGAEGRSSRQFVVFELPGEIAPLTVAEAPGAPHPLSLGELRSAGILNFVFDDNVDDRGFHWWPIFTDHRTKSRRTQIPIESYARAPLGFAGTTTPYVTASANNSKREWGRHTDEGFVAGAQQIDRIWGLTDDERPKTVTTPNRTL